jgi:hypothetical protein
MARIKAFRQQAPMHAFLSTVRGKIDIPVQTTMPQRLPCFRVWSYRRDRECEPFGRAHLTRIGGPQFQAVNVLKIRLAIFDRLPCAVYELRGSFKLRRFVMLSALNAAPGVPNYSRSHRNVSLSSR